MRFIPTGKIAHGAIHNVAKSGFKQVHRRFRFADHRELRENVVCN